MDKPDIYDASVRWVVASAVLGDSSTQPRFMNAEVLMIQILMLHDELLAALYISRVHWLSADLSEERSLWSRRTRHMITPVGPVEISLYGAFSYDNMSIMLDD